jgi:hypothetical protein
LSNNASDRKLHSRTPDPADVKETPITQAPVALASGAVPDVAANGKTRLPNVGNAPKFVAPSHGGVDILKLLTELEDQIENTRKVPFGGMIGFDEDKFHMTIMKIRANLPEEMKRASKLARDQERIVEETLENAERIKEDARKAALLEMERGKKEAVALREQVRIEADRQRSQAGSALADAQAAAEREAQHILEEARAQGRQMIAAAHQEAAQLVGDNEIVQQAMVMAQDLQMRAQTEAQAVRRGADEYARDVLINLENVLGKATIQVQRGRELLEKPR